MVNTEVTIISRDTVKPAATSSSAHHHLKPYKLCIIDQLIPTTYTPMVFFYPITDPNFQCPQNPSPLENFTLTYPHFVLPIFREDQKQPVHP
ncbi:hypothetical protein M0R45_026966 [Rubus argutus]|uniref:Uncharacterized protein n=1 Tax=Rubus argutus TaxID=59490 RepID=A0AAW1X2R2_RUBAR